MSSLRARHGNVDMILALELRIVFNSLEKQQEL